MNEEIAKAFAEEFMATAEEYTTAAEKDAHQEPLKAQACLAAALVMGGLAQVVARVFAKLNGIDIDKL